MTPDIGSVCYFTFKSNFQTLNGIYKTQAETSFEQAIKANVSFVENLYKPVGLTEGDYLADLNQIKLSSVLVLEPISGDPLIYIPTSLLATIPDPTIREYFPLSVVLSLGIHKNTQVILPLLNEIKDLLQQSLGITDGLQVISNSSNKEYLTDVQFGIVQAARNAQKGNFSPTRIQLEEEKRKNQILSTRLARYEELLIQLGQPVQP